MRNWGRVIRWGWKEGSSVLGMEDVSESESESESEAASSGMKSSPALAGSGGPSVWTWPGVVSMAILLVLCRC